MPNVPALVQLAGTAVQFTGAPAGSTAARALSHALARRSNMTKCMRQLSSSCTSAVARPASSSAGAAPPCGAPAAAPSPAVPPQPWPDGGAARTPAGAAGGALPSSCRAPPRPALAAPSPCATATSGVASRRASPAARAHPSRRTALPLAETSRRATAIAPSWSQGTGDQGRQGGCPPAHRARRAATCASAAQYPLARGPL